MTFFLKFVLFKSARLNFRQSCRNILFRINNLYFQDTCKSLTPSFSRRSTGITPTEADLDTPDKVDEMGELLGLSPVSTPKSSKSDPLTKLSGSSTSLLVPDVPVYRVPPKPKPPTSPKPDKVARLTKVGYYTAFNYLFESGP